MARRFGDIAPVQLERLIDTARAGSAQPVISLRVLTWVNRSGAERRVRIDFPQSFEFRLGEIGSGTSKTSGPIASELTSRYGQFAHTHLSHKGGLN